MKIAMIGQKGVPARAGGVERHVEELAKELAKGGEEITVYGRSWYQKLYDFESVFDFKTQSIPSIKTKHLDTITYTLLATLHALISGFDIYHFHGVGPALLCWIPRLLRPRAKVVVTFHCLDQFHGKWGPFARFVLLLGEWAACRFPHLTIAVSPLIAAYCWEKYNRLAVIVPNGIDQKIAYESGDAGVLDNFDLRRGKYFLLVSRFVRHKRVHDAIEAYRMLIQSEMINPNEMRLVIVGSGSFTDEYENEIKLLSSHVPGVVLTGELPGDEVFALMRNCALSLHTSESEGMSLTLLEAMAAGAPVLTSDIPEYRDITSSYGFTFQTGDPSHLAQRIATLLQNIEQARARAELAKQVVLRTYPWGRVAARTRELYSMLVGQQEASFRHCERSEAIPDRQCS